VTATENTALVHPTHQARSRAQTERIIRAGLDLVREHNFAELRMEQIAERAGCSVGTLYKRFANKDALLEVLAMAARDDIIVDAAPFGLDGPAAATSLDELIHTLVVFLVRNFRRHEGLLRALMVQQMLKPGTNMVLQETSQEIAAALSDAVRRFAPPDIDPETFQRRAQQAYQIAIGLLVNMVINAPGPIRLDDDGLVATLTAIMANQLFPTSRVSAPT